MNALTEIERGRSEAAHTHLELRPMERYLAPPLNTPFPLEYAFHLLGDVRGKTVLDLGCGTGENMPALLALGANVIALDLSPELLELARKRMALIGKENEPVFIEASAYATTLPDASVDVVLCASVLHHLNIPRAMNEISRVLKPDGAVIVKEPVRFSRMFGKLRALFPAQEDISENEHPFGREEFAMIKQGWKASGERYFRSPLIPIAKKFLSRETMLKVWKWDAWLLAHIHSLRRFASTRTVKLEKLIAACK